MQRIRALILRNRYSLLISTLIVYMLVLVVEGQLTGREPRVVDFENPFFDLQLDMERLREMEERDRR